MVGAQLTEAFEFDDPFIRPLNNPLRASLWYIAGCLSTHRGSCVHLAINFSLGHVAFCLQCWKVVERQNHENHLFVFQTVVDQNGMTVARSTSTAYLLQPVGMKEGENDVQNIHVWPEQFF